MRKTRRTEEGYSIIVIAALFIAFMTVAAALLEGDVVNEQVSRQKDAAQQLNALEKALIQYALFTNGRYPCPAQYNVAYTDNSFGLSVGPDCVTTTTSGIDYLPTGVASADDNVRGMVPVRSLAAYGISIDDAFDPWGNRIMYVVNKQLTGGGSGTATTRPTLSEGYTGQSFTSPDFLLISYGKDHVGAIVKSQLSSLTPTIACTSDGNDRTKDCGATISFVRHPLNTSTAASSSNYFDDIVAAYTAGADCAVQTINWTVGANSCSGTSGVPYPNGATEAILTSSSGKVGDVTIACNNGQFVQSDPHCAPSSGATCTWVAYSIVWPNTTSACPTTPSPGSPPYYSTYTSCGADAVAGTQMLYATAAAEYATPQAATCAVSGGCTYDGTNFISTASMLQCRP